jgi:hypothetical protein
LAVCSEVLVAAVTANAEMPGLTAMRCPRSRKLTVRFTTTVWLM